MLQSDAIEALASLADWRCPGTRVHQSLGGSDTNQSWCIERDGERFVLRIDTPLVATLGLDREREVSLRAVAAHAGLGPAVAFFDPAKGLLISEFLPGRAWCDQDMHDTANLARLAERLRLLHALPPVGEPFCLAAAIVRYADKAENAKAQSVAREALGLLGQVTPRQHAICHNDLIAENVIDGEQLWFIDWEYAGVGDPLFDLAIVIEHHQLPVSLARPFVQHCLGATNSVVNADLDRYGRIYKCLVRLWTELAVSDSPPKI